jgi:hypothetical protein
LNDAAKPFATSIMLKIYYKTCCSKNNFKVGADNGWKLAETM